MLIGILKCVFLIFGIVYGFGNIGRLKYGKVIGTFQLYAMAIGIVGFLALQFNWLGL